LGPALASLLLTGVIGQSQHAAQVVRGRVFLEFAAESKEDLFAQCPMLFWLHHQNQTILCGDPQAPEPSGHGATDGSETFLEELSRRAGRHGTVTDADVQTLFRKIFRSEGVQPRKSSAAPTPYVHTQQSLRIMWTIACSTMRQLSCERKAQPCSPVLLSGDTGTGKTYLLFKYLELLRDSGVLENFHDKVSVWTLSAKFLRPNVEKLGKKIKDSVAEAHAHLATADHPLPVCPFILDEVLPLIFSHLVLPYAVSGL
jgi:hypothetical protein